MHHPFFAFLPRRSTLAVLAAISTLTACSSTTPLPPWGNAPTQSAPVRTVPVPGTRTNPPQSAAPSAQPATAIAHPLGGAGTLYGHPSIPYTPAVAALFPDPAVQYQTPGLAQERSSFTTNAELAQELQRLTVRPGAYGTLLSAPQIGTSQNGAPLWALIATQAAKTDPASLEASGRPTVLLLSQQQGDEPVGAEALLVVARELAPGGLLEPLLAQINVIIVPRANPDGAATGQRTTANGTDLAHDHLLLATPEAQALAQLMHAYRPAAVLELQEYPAAGAFFEQFQALQRYDALVQYANTANTAEFITKAAREWYYEPLMKALQNQGLSAHLNYHPHKPSRGLAMADVQPDTLINTSSLKNAAALVVKTRGSDLGRMHLQRRVHTQVTAASSALRSSATRAASLQQVRSFVVRETSGQACQGQTIVHAERTPGQVEIAMLNPMTGMQRTEQVAWQSALQLRPLLSRSRPCGYWLGPTAQPAIERLQLLGLQVLRVAEAGSVLAETTDSLFSSSSALTAPARSAIDIPANSYYVPLNQPWAPLASAALEAGTAGSYLAQGLVSDAASQARIMATPALVFEDSD